MNILRSIFLYCLIFTSFSVACSKESEKRDGIGDIPEPVISHLSPGRGKEGDKINIVGQNFGEDIANVKISFGEIFLDPIAISNRTVSFTVPKFSGSKEVDVSVHVGEKKTTVLRFVYDETNNSPIVRILAIGNSFSQDAVETHLYELAKEKGISVVIGNLYIGGASLALHKNNIEQNVSAYEYRKIDQEGILKVYPKTSIATALADEHWDYVSFQQVSENSGQLETVQTSLPEVFNYVKERTRNPNIKYIYHQTWAYAESSSHTGFLNYNSNQIEMYNAITHVSSKVKEIVPIDIVVPVGTAIQNGRTSFIGDHFTRDGWHLAIPLGRYTAACTWFETLFGHTVIGMEYKPTGLSDLEANIAKHAAHGAVLKPFEITELTEFKDIGYVVLDNPVFLDFGNGPVSDKWNQIRTFSQGTTANLKDNLGNYVGITLEIKERFNDINASGATVTNTPFGMPENVSKYSFFGNSKALHGAILVEQSVVEFSGLNPSIAYDFCFFASRMGVTDNRETKYTCTGANTVIKTLDASNNNAKTVCATGVLPNSAGKISVTITAGDNNDNTTGYYYLTAMRLTAN